MNYRQHGGIPAPVVDLCRVIEQYHDRDVNPAAVARLVRYWTRRTPYTRSQICAALIKATKISNHIGLRKYGLL